MAEPKTKPTGASVKRFLERIPDAEKRRDCFEILELMQKATGARPKMWGGSIVGFGSYRYRYASGQEGDWPLAAFSPRKQNLSLYIMAGFKGREDLLEKLGKHSTGKACLYIQRLADVDRRVLERLIRESVRRVRKAFPK